MTTGTIPTAASPDVLAAIVAATRRTVDVRRELVSLRSLEVEAARWQPRGTAVLDALGAPGVNIIAECKRRSPSKGGLRDPYDPVAIAVAYARAGATAISVLTEPSFFDGSLDHLRAVRAAVSTFLLRKDFIVDEYQLAEAQACGADAVLLIVAALEQGALVALREAAEARGFAVLVEVHTAEELTRAYDAGARLIGVNSRNLKTLGVSLDTTLAVASSFRTGTIGVAESGIRSHADVERLRAAGYAAFLIGERFMVAEDPGAALAAVRGGTT